MEREACVCDHGYERSDLCAEIIIIIIIITVNIDYSCWLFLWKLSNGTRIGLEETRHIICNRKRNGSLTYYKQYTIR